MSKFQIVKGITDNLSETPFAEGKVYFTYDNTESTNLNIYADIDGTRRKIKEGVQRDELDDYLLKTDIADWAKETTKPTYTAAEVGATTTSEVNSLIVSAIGNINQFNVAIVSTLPTENIDDHTLYFMSNGGSDDSIYDEWMYINNNWEKIGTTAVDLSGYMQTSHPANGITSTDISNWNAKVSDDKTWNGVTLNKTGGMGSSNIYVPYATSTKASSMNYWTASETPSNYAIAKYDSSAYLKSTTPSANDNSTKVATTAYVDAAIPDVSGYVSKSGDTMTGRLTLNYNNGTDGLKIYGLNGTYINIQGGGYVGNTTNYTPILQFRSGEPNSSDSTIISRVYLQGIATPTSNDQAANKEYVDNKIPKVYSSTNTNGYLTMDTLPIYDGTVV